MESTVSSSPKITGVLAERVVYLLKNPELRRKIGENNRHIIVNRYNYYSEMEKLEQIYAELLKDEAT
jgi:glycosyltransferase involved in cell wall biosynthesis